MAIISGFELDGLIITWGSYAGEIPQSLAKTNSDKIIEVLIGVGMAGFTSGTHQQGLQ